MAELRAYIKKETCSFVRKKREEKGLSPNLSVNGYLLGDIEERAEQIPCCELFPILEQLASSQELAKWWLDFQMGINQIKIRQKLH